MLQNGEPGRQIQGRSVGAVPVDDEDPPESVVGQAAADVLHVADEDVPIDGQGPVKIHVVGAVAVGDGGRQDRLLGDSGDGPLANLGAEPDVHVHREVGAVILVGRHRQDRHPVAAGRFLDLMPDHLGKPVFHLFLLPVQVSLSNSYNGTSWGSRTESIGP